MLISFLSSFIAGAIFPLAFAPLGIYQFAVISFLLLLFTWETATPKQTFLQGLYYGLGAFGVGVSWVYISIHDYGNTNFILSGIITALFVLILSLFPAFAGYCLNHFFPQNKTTKWIIAFPTLWVLFEWIRSWLFTGFPWLLAGYSQTNSLLHNYAPIIGIYGVSFLVALCSALLFIFIKTSHRLFSGILIFLIWIGGWGLSNIHWSTPIGKPITISLIQGNIPQSIKWDPEQARQSLEIYQNFTSNHWSSDLIIWPETAITFLLPDATSFLEQLDQEALKNHSAIIAGIPIFHQNKYYNGLVVLGDGKGQYIKRHLVPFGEYVPLQNLLRGLIGFLDLPMSDLSPGLNKQAILKIKNFSAAAFICYEVAYSDLLRSNLPEANILMTLSNDTWFGHSIALGQHRQIAQFAAQATGRYMLVATNSGETVIIDSQGIILEKIPAFSAGVLTGTAQIMQGITPWVKIGNTPIIALLFALLFFVRLRCQ